MATPILAPTPESGQTDSLTFPRRHFLAGLLGALVAPLLPKLNPQPIMPTLAGAWHSLPGAGHLLFFRPAPTRLEVSGGEAMALAAACYRTAQAEDNPILKQFYQEWTATFTALSDEPGFDPAG